MESKEFVVFGRVQGFRFRKNVKEFAETNSLNGFVENLRDGSVRVVLQGEGKKVDFFSEFLNKKNQFWVVRNYEVCEKGISQTYQNFEIRRRQNFLFDKLLHFADYFKHGLELDNPRNYLDKVPRHVAIIPDGNRRWAKVKGLVETVGHEMSGSYDNLKKIFDEAEKLGVKYISFWAFSSENWKRSESEKKFLFDLILGVVKKLRKNKSNNKLRFRHIGRKDRIPKELAVELEKLEKETKKYKDFNLNLCLDYGGRDEIVRAVNKILRSSVAKIINEDDFESYLDTAGIPDPELVIRTSGEKRTSGFMPYQSAYAELYFAKKFFPDFTSRDLRKAIFSFGKRKRRFGG